MGRFIRIFVLAAAAALAACGESAPEKPPAPARTRIVFVTDWKAQAEHGGYYQALADGIYARRGLDVRIVQGGPQVNVGQMLAGGAADFGIGSNAFVALNLVRERARIRAVMAVFQKDPQVLITHPRGDIRGLADMKGKPILIADAAQATFWIWLKVKFGFDDTQIRKYTFNLAPFLTDPTAIQEGYISSEPYLIEREGRFKPQVYQLADYGYPGYANMVLVPDKWIDERPEAVQAFVEASIEGWAQYLFGDPSRADALIKRDNPEMTDDLLAHAREKLRDSGTVMPPEIGQLGLGGMTDMRWAAFFATMAQYGVYPKTMRWQDAYTTRFVNRNYSARFLRSQVQIDPPGAPAPAAPAPIPVPVPVPAPVPVPVPVPVPAPVPAPAP
jgi:NitT/TauT family transport system substrate-binding protein